MTRSGLGVEKAERAWVLGEGVVRWLLDASLTVTVVVQEGREGSAWASRSATTPLVLILNLPSPTGWPITCPRRRRGRVGCRRASGGRRQRRAPPCGTWPSCAGRSGRTPAQPRRHAVSKRWGRMIAAECVCCRAHLDAGGGGDAGVPEEGVQGHGPVVLQRAGLHQPVTSWQHEAS